MNGLNVFMVNSINEEFCCLLWFNATLDQRDAVTKLQTYFNNVFRCICRAPLWKEQH